MKKINKKLMALVLAVVMMLTAMPLSVMADKINIEITQEAISVPYLDENGELQFAQDVTSLTGMETTLTSGWYLAQGELNFPSRITISGDVHLILADGAHFNAENGGIDVSNLMVYAQSTDNNIGRLTAVSNNSQAGIGSVGANNRVIINGGMIIANGGNHGGAGIGGGCIVIINGGLITATGGTNNTGGSGIGSNATSATSGTIIINGGTITAVGGTSTNFGNMWIPAGIGINPTVASTSSVIINGGNITAIGGNNPLNGFSGPAINAANVSVTAQSYAFWTNTTISDPNGPPRRYPIPSLGFVNNTNLRFVRIETTNEVITPPKHNITYEILGGNGTLAVSAENYAEIYEGTEVIFTATPSNGWVVKDWTINGVAQRSKSLEFALVIFENTHIALEFEPHIRESVTYLDENGVKQIAYNVSILDREETQLQSGWYVVDSNIVYSLFSMESRISILGDVHIILADNSNLTANGGINVPERHKLTLYAQSEGEAMGSLTAFGMLGTGAAIGGNSALMMLDGISAGEININGGLIRAISLINSNRSGAAIGGSGSGISAGVGGSGGNITINGGITEAISNSNNAAIGGGDSNSGTGGSGGIIIINGGQVRAENIGNGVAIGGGSNRSGVNGSGGIITINGGEVTATTNNTNTPAINAALTLTAPAYTYWTNTIPVDPGGPGLRYPDDPAFVNDASFRFVKIEAEAQLSAIHPVTYVTIGNGTLTATMDNGASVLQGTEVTFTAAPAQGFRVKEWRVNGVPQENTTNTLTMTILAETYVTVEFEPAIIYGDVNDDGVVNGADLTRLARFLAGHDNITINELNSDVTADGAINGADLTRLARFLAGHGVVLGE